MPKLRESHRGHVVQTAVRPIVIIGHTPAIHDISNFVNMLEQLLADVQLGETVVAA